MTYEAIRRETDGPVMTITLNRPEKLNAYTARMQVEPSSPVSLAKARPCSRARGPLPYLHHEGIARS